MNRRSAVGCLLSIFPLGLLASVAWGKEPSRVVHLAFVSPFSSSGDARGIDAFWERLRELGWQRAENLIVDVRWADGRLDQLPMLMEQVVKQKPDVLVTYSTRGALAAKNATTSIPIVVTNMAEPVRSGVTSSLAHPDGNLTGLSLGWAEGTAGKLLELLQETVPHLSSVALVANLRDPQIPQRVKEVQDIARTRNIKIRLIEITDPGALDSAFNKAHKTAQAMVVLSDLVTFEHRGKVASLAARYHLPAMYPLREFVESGGLMSYGPDRVVLFRRAADYVDRILNGAKPADLPFEQPTQYEFIVNLKAARATGISVPTAILARANEVIQ